jgi:hypothetical protein
MVSINGVEVVRSEQCCSFTLLAQLGMKHLFYLATKTSHLLSFPPTSLAAPVRLLFLFFYVTQP